MRLFVAAVPPAALQRAAVARTAPLRAAGADVKWVETENLHLTLKFLGEVAAARVDPVRESLRAVGSSLHPFEVRLAGVGSFPPRGRPRVVWMGIESAGPLVALQRAVESALQPHGFAREARPFAAHLTLGRLRSPRGAELLTRVMIPLRTVDLGAWAVRGFTLMESRLSSSGPTYVPVEVFPLAS